MSERATWQEWLRENGSRWLLYARQQTRTETDAEDVLQDALVKTWKACQGEVGPDTVGLVFANIRRCAIDRARSSQQRQLREQKVYEDSAQTESAWFEEADDRKAQAEALQKALEAIPGKYREVVTLKIWGELTFAQIAEQLGESPNTVASRYRYGLERLRRVLGDEGEMVA